MNAQVKISAKALEDMEAIYDYIANQFQAPDAAMKWYNRIAEAIQSLAFFPERCRLFEPGCEHCPGVRRLLVGRYSVFYGVNECTVTVFRVLYSSSDLEARLRT